MCASSAIIITKKAIKTAAREQKFCILDAESVFKDYDVHRVQSLEEKLEDLDSLSLNYWLTKFAQELLIRTVVAIRLVPCMELFVA